jgi:hypothetical protein
MVTRTHHHVTLYVPCPFCSTLLSISVHIHSVFCVPSVIMCSSALILSSFRCNCSAVWDAVSLHYTCTEGAVSNMSTTRYRTQVLVRTYSVEMLYVILAKRWENVWLKTCIILNFLAQSVYLSPAPYSKTFQVYPITFSTTQSYAPNVTFLVPVNLNTPKPCHSKQQHLTAHKLRSCNKFFLHNCNISPPVQTVHDINGPTPTAPSTDHVPHSIQLPQSVKATHPALCNAACLPVPYKVF